MKKKMFGLFGLGLALTVGLMGCGSEEKQVTGDNTGGDKKEVLEFFHGYHQAKDEWPVAQVMRDLYDDFAKNHATGNVEFKATPVSGSLVDLMNNKVASGEFPNVIDLAGNAVSLAAIEQGLTLDLKPFIDKNNLEKNVGINYTQNDVNGKIYTVHEQLFTMGLWYNQDIFRSASAKTPGEWKTWADFSEAMALVRKEEGVYAFGAGEPALRLLNTALGGTEAGRESLENPLSKETIESADFSNALKTVMTAVNENGSENAGGDADTYSADFSQGKSSVFFNGVWAAGGMVENPAIAPGIYPGDVAISSAGGGITISSKMSEQKEKLALEFLEYMTSDEVQEVIFTKVGANPSNQNIDIKGLSESSEDPTVALLGEAISQVNAAAYQVPTISDSWGGDVNSALVNALSESSAKNIDIDQKVKETQDILLALIS